MAANPSVIGRTTRVRGRITGEVDLDVQGFVEGDVTVGGDVTVDSHGMVGGGIRGRRLVVRGAVKGDLHAEEAIALEDGARVLGDVRAPRVSIAPGALVRGFVETGEGNGAPARTTRAQPAVRPVATPARVAPAAKVQAAPAPAPSKPAEKTAPATHASGGNHAPAAPGPRRPPPPVVPALKKAKGQIAKKKER